MYDIVEVPSDAPDALEHVGSKRKFWYTRVRTDTEEDWLFKAARQDTGEDWAEKVAAELCDLIGLPHATYELATWTEEKNGESKEWDGVVTRRIEEENERLLLGNEVLAGHVNRYPEAAMAWLHRLEEIDATAVEAIFDRIPGARISDASIDFALRQLSLNRDALLDLDF
jgi:hypothetical protein